MVDNGDDRSIVNLPEQFNGRPYVLNKTDPRGSNVFRVLYNGTQSYNTFRYSCEIDYTCRRLQRMSTMCHIIERDDR